MKPNWDRIDARLAHQIFSWKFDVILSLYIGCMERIYIGYCLLSNPFHLFMNKICLKWKWAHIYTTQYKETKLHQISRRKFGAPDVRQFCPSLVVNIVQHSHSYNSFLLIIVACIMILLVAILYRDHVGFCVIVTLEYLNQKYKYQSLENHICLKLPVFVVICLKNLDNFTKTCMIVTQTWAIDLLSL
jgi:hypothetical protein